MEEEEDINSWLRCAALTVARIGLQLPRWSWVERKVSVPQMAWCLDPKASTE
jgi:hypothetical protein